MRQRVRGCFVVICMCRISLTVGNVCRNCHAQFRNEYNCQDLNVMNYIPNGMAKPKRHYSIEIGRTRKPTPRAQWGGCMRGYEERITG